MDETVVPEPAHELLLRLAGWIDDDLLDDARELVAVGEDGHALELVAAALAADGVALPGAVRADLVRATREARAVLDADTALAPAREDVDEHRFTAVPPAGGEAVVAAVRALPARRLAGCDVRLAWRLTPAGAAPGPLPRPVLLVRPESPGGPDDVLAYQLTTVLRRAGAPMSVEVLPAGRAPAPYHVRALRESAPVASAATPEPVAGTRSAGVTEPVPSPTGDGSADRLDDPAARHIATPGAGGGGLDAGSRLGGTDAGPGSADPGPATAAEPPIADTPPAGLVAGGTPPAGPAMGVVNGRPPGDDPATGGPTADGAAAARSVAGPAVLTDEVLAADDAAADNTPPTGSPIVDDRTAVTDAVPDRIGSLEPASSYGPVPGGPPRTDPLAAVRGGPPYGATSRGGAHHLRTDPDARDDHPLPIPPLRAVPGPDRRGGPLPFELPGDRAGVPPLPSGADLFGRPDDLPAPQPLPMRQAGGRRRLVEEPGGVTPIARTPQPAPLPRRTRPSPRPVPTEPGPHASPLADTPTYAAMNELAIESSALHELAREPSALHELAREPSALHDPLLGPLRQPLLDPLLDPSFTPGEPEPGRDESAWTGEWASGDWSVANPATEPPPAPGRPAQPKRLTDADRELLARLQAGQQR